MQILLCLGLLWGHSSFAAIYGPDQRKNITQKSPWSQVSESVALVVPSLFLEEKSQDHLFHSEFHERIYAEEVGICPSEKFAKETSFGHCTAFLVHPRFMVSAGHCVIATGTIENKAHDYCENFSFWFSYDKKDPSLFPLGSKIPKKDVVRCKKVIYAENNMKIEPSSDPIDFIIYELEEPVLDRKPLKIFNGSHRTGETLLTMGHPHGLPKKISGYSPLIKEYNKVLTVNLDTLSGNSGGPVFNRKKEVVGILIAGHQFDTYKPKGKQCEKINRCNSRGTKCKENSDLPTPNLVLKNSVWKPYLDKYMNQQVMM